MASLTGEGLKAFATSKLGTNYIYGYKFSFGNATQNKVAQLAASYPKVFTKTYLNKIYTRGMIGKPAVDCSGLIAGYTGIMLGSSQLRSKASKRLNVKDYKTFPVGTVLWRNGHVGIFCGQDNNGEYYCIEAKGIDYGTVKSILNDKNITKWSEGLLFSYITYSAVSFNSGSTTASTPTAKPKQIIPGFDKNPFVVSDKAVLKKDDKGQAVKWLQYELIEAGYGEKFKWNGRWYNPVTIDGDFGPITDAAVRAFQMSSKLVVDGEVGPKTINALRLNV